MDRTLLGAFATLLLVAGGVFWWQGRAIEAVGTPPPAPVQPASISEDEIPVATISDVEGPALPEATEMSDEQRRFARYDRNYDLIITRNEMLSTRVAAFRKLDVDGNNLLTFEEWAVTTVKRFEGADADGDARLTPAEFATTRRPEKPRKQRCSC